MLPADFISGSLRQILRNRKRYQAVITIIALGIAGIICVVTLGKALERAIGRDLELLGRACLIEVCWSPDARFSVPNARFSQQDVNDLRDLPGVVFAAPFVRKTAQRFFSGSRRFSGLLVGVESDYFDSLDLRMSQGQKISESDVASRRAICVIGSTIMSELFPGAASVLGKAIRTEGFSLQVIGVVGGLEDRFYAETVIVPISLVLTGFSGVTGINGIYVRAEDWDAVADVQRRILTVLRRNQPGNKDYIQAHYYPQKIKTIRSAVFLVKLLLFVALGVTLLLGTIGISSLMLAAVQERTKDIGLRRAVGATEVSILAQFLAEAIAISATGSLIGVVVAILVVEVAQVALNLLPAYGAFALSVLGSLVVGIVLGACAGFIPARKASRLDPVEAMRFE